MSIFSVDARDTGNSRFEGDKFPVLFWKIPENSRFKINDPFTRKRVHYCQKVVETGSFLSTAQNKAFKFIG